MRKTAVKAGGGPIVAVMLAAFMGCAGDPANQRAASSPSPSGTALIDQHEVQTTFRTEHVSPFSLRPS